MAAGKTLLLLLDFGCFAHNSAIHHRDVDFQPAFVLSHGGLDIPQQLIASLRV